MRFNASDISTLRTSGSTPLKKELIDDTACFFIRSNDYSSTNYVIGLDVGICFDKESGFFRLLERWVSNKFDIPKAAYLTIFDSNIHEDSLCNFGVALNVIFTNGCIPEYHIVLGGTIDGENNYSEILSDCVPSEQEELLIQEYIDRIEDALLKGQARLLGKIPA